MSQNTIKITIIIENYKVSLQHLVDMSWEYP